jgi:thiol-disulfide isomerase/thioredoxin
MPKQRLGSSLGIAGIILIMALVFGGLSLTQAQDESNFRYKGEVAAPDFPEDIDWLNVSAPLDWETLRGKIVILDFWTYGCINCIHIIPDLHKLEEEFADSLVVIGVHSAKFDNEGETDNIRQIVQRYGVTHPVVNDSEFVVWRTYGVRAWPTTVLIDPTGKVVGGRSGEGVYEVFKPILDIMVEEYGAAGLLNPEPIATLAPEFSPRDNITLNYPGKVLADTAGNRLIISDSSNHRLIVADLDTYENVEVIGTGTAGYTEGDYATAQFKLPQGLAIDGDILYVADTGNHAIRQIDLAARTVSTLAGTGQQARTYPPLPGNAPAVELSSPWDLTLHNNILYIAMAGPHQLWRIDLGTGEVAPHAGSGREEIIDGPLREAQMAQPSGIDTDGTVLYFADAESSSIRQADIDTAGRVETIVGTGLFDFGDTDGTGEEVLLQHALGVVVAEDGLLYVTDTYNNKIKRIDPATRTSETLAGSIEPGWVDGDLASARFYEPGGLDYANGKLYIADTNNHAIRILDLATGVVSTVEFPDTTALLIQSDTASTLDASLIPGTSFTPVGGDNIINLGLVSLGAGEGEIVLDIQLPYGYKLNDSAPFTAVTGSDAVVTLTEDTANYREVLPELPVRLPANFQTGQTQFNSQLTIYWCEAINYTLCFIERVSFTGTVLVGDSSDNHELVLSYELVPPQLPQ